MWLAKAALNNETLKLKMSAFDGLNCKESQEIPTDPENVM